MWHAGGNGGVDDRGGAVLVGTAHGLAVVRGLDQPRRWITASAPANACCAAARRQGDGEPIGAHSAQLWGGSRGRCYAG